MRLALLLTLVVALCASATATLHAIGILATSGTTATAQALVLDPVSGSINASSSVFKFTAPAAALICEANFALRSSGWQIAAPANRFQPLDALYFDWRSGTQIGSLTTDPTGMKLFSWTPDQNTDGFIGMFTNVSDVGDPTWFLATVSGTGAFYTVGQWPEWMNSHQPCLSVYDPINHVYWFSQYENDITAVSGSDGFYLGSWEFIGASIQSMEWTRDNTTSAVFLLINSYPFLNGDGRGHIIRAYLADGGGVKQETVADLAGGDYAFGYASSALDPTTQLFYTVVTTGLAPNTTNPRIVTVDVKSRNIVRSAPINPDVLNSFAGGLQSFTSF